MVYLFGICYNGSSAFISEEKVIPESGNIYAELKCHPRWEGKTLEEIIAEFEAAINLVNLDYIFQNPPELILPLLPFSPEPMFPLNSRPRLL